MNIHIKYITIISILAIMLVTFLIIGYYHINGGADTSDSLIDMGNISCYPSDVDKYNYCETDRYYINGSRSMVGGYT